MAFHQGLKPIRLISTLGMVMPCYKNGRPVFLQPASQAAKTPESLADVAALSAWAMQDSKIAERATRHIP
jgi:hypothetical protein